MQLYPRPRRARAGRQGIAGGGRPTRLRDAVLRADRPHQPRVLGTAVWGRRGVGVGVAGWGAASPSHLGFSLKQHARPQRAELEPTEKVGHGQMPTPPNSHPPVHRTSLRENLVL